MTERDSTSRESDAEALQHEYQRLSRQYESRCAQLVEAIETINLELASRIQAEQALRESEGRLSVIVGTAAEGIITIDGRGVIDTFNAASERIFGYAAEEVIGKNVSVLMPPSYAAHHDEYLANFLRTGEKKVIGIGREVVGLRKDGTTFPMDLAVGEAKTARGPIFTGIVRDVSDRKLSELRLREADRMATIGALAAGLGHDMNNVLLPVRAHLNALKAVDGTAAQRGEHVDRIVRSIAYLQQLADGLHFLAMDPDKLDGANVSTNLRDWWSQAGPLLTKSVPKHVTVNALLPSDLPEAGIAAHTLTQAVLNLLVNAGAAIPADPAHGPGLVRVWAKLESRGTVVRIGVTDNGTGMTDEVRRHACDMFFTTRSRGLGTGLGLAIVRRAVERAGGSVVIESVLGEGTTVAMLIPAAQCRRHPVP